MKPIFTVPNFLIAGSVAASAWSLLYFAQNHSVEGYMQGTMGSLLATLLGVLFGVPIALRLSQVQLREQERITKATAAMEARERKRLLLVHLRRELIDNKAQVVACREPLITGGKRSVLTKPLRTELWSAFSDSGDLRYVDSPSLLASLAEAFHQVKATASMERLLIEVTHFPGVRLAATRTIDQQILEYLTLDDPPLLATIDKAISQIDQELSQLAQ